MVREPFTFQFYVVTKPFIGTLPCYTSGLSNLIYLHGRTQESLDMRLTNS